MLSKISRRQNKTLCNDNSFLVFSRKVILKWVGMPDFWELQVEK